MLLPCPWQLPYGISNPHKLFKHMDIDQSGRIDFAEFSKMTRSVLKLGKDAVSDQKLWGLWRAIDENGNGFICAGEFGRFMREVTNVSTQEVGLQSKVREVAVKSELQKSEMWARNKAAEADRAAAQMEAEAKRLEKLLSAVSSSNVPALPSLGSSKSTPALGRNLTCAASSSASDPSQQSPEEEISPTKSPAKPPRRQQKALTMLSQELRFGGANRVSASGKPKRERGWLKEDRGGSLNAGAMPSPMPQSMQHMILPPPRPPNMLQALP